MLSRVASSLYWLGRYVERSEHLARFLRVQYFSILDTPMSQNKEFVLRSILGMYGIENEEDTLDEKQILLQVGLDIKESASVISAVSMARENARSVRHVLSTELWEVINQYYHFVKEYNQEYYQTRGLYDFTSQLAKHCSIIRSYLDHTLIHDEIWLFVELGIYLERASQIVRILSNKLDDIEILGEKGDNTPLMRYQWTITLKVMEAFDMHRRVYRKPLNQRSVMEFLVSNPRFPRSIAYNLNRVHSLITQLNQMTKSGDEALFRSGKLSSRLQYLEYPEVKDNLSHFLSDALDKIYQLHELINKTYFNS